MGEEPAEPLPRDVGLAHRPPAVLLPERVVDPPVGEQNARRERQPEVVEGRTQRGPLGAVDVEQRVVEVEKDGVEAGQGKVSVGATWRGR